MSSNKWCIGFIVLICIHNVFTNRIQMIEVMTSDCDHCGMSFLGHLSVQVSLINQNCCNFKQLTFRFVVPNVALLKI